MSTYSDDRIGNISKKMLDELKKRGLLKKQLPSFQMTAEIRKSFTKFNRLNDEIAAIAKKRVASMGKAQPEGSAGWRVLYDKAFAEEWNRH